MIAVSIPVAVSLEPMLGSTHVHSVSTLSIIQILPDPVTPQTVRNALKQNDFHAVVKKKCPLLKKAHRLDCLKFARYHKN